MRRRSADDRLALAERHAEALRLPLNASDNLSQDSRAASRAAAFAASRGAGAAFGLAALRLVFCGGFDLSEPELITEAAAAANLPVGLTLRAASNPEYDATLDATARGLLTRGILSTPAVRIGQSWVDGFGAVPGLAELPAAELHRLPVRPLA